VSSRDFVPELIPRAERPDARFGAIAVPLGTWATGRDPFGPEDGATGQDGVSGPDPVLECPQCGSLWDLDGPEFCPECGVRIEVLAGAEWDRG
jgi:hypothetical protein